MFIIPDEYEEPSHEGLSPYVEFVALLALKKSFSEGQKLGPRFEETQEDSRTCQTDFLDALLVHDSSIHRGRT